MAVPWSDKKAAGRLDELQVARRVRANGLNQIQAQKQAEVEKQIAAQGFCKRFAFLPMLPKSFAGRYPAASQSSDWRGNVHQIR